MKSKTKQHPQLRIFPAPRKNQKLLKGHWIYVHGPILIENIDELIRHGATVVFTNKPSEEVK